MLPIPQLENWTLLSASNRSDTTTGWCYHQHIHSRGIKLQRGLFANAWFFCVSQPCCCWCNWNQHHVNETPHPPPPRLSKSGHSLVILYTGHQSFCCVWLRAWVIQYVFTWTRTQKKMQRHAIAHTLISTSMALLHMYSLAAKFNTAVENMAAI